MVRSSKFSEDKKPSGQIKPYHDDVTSKKHKEENNVSRLASMHNGPGPQKSIVKPHSFRQSLKLNLNSNKAKEDEFHADTLRSDVEFLGPWPEGKSVVVVSCCCIP